MLRNRNERQAAARVANAVRQVFAGGKVRTGDRGGRATTADFVEALLAAM